MRFSGFLKPGRRERRLSSNGTLLLPNGELTEERRKLFEQQRPTEIERRETAKTLSDYLKLGQDCLKLVRRKISSLRSAMNRPVRDDRRRKGRHQQLRPDVIERRKNPAGVPPISASRQWSKSLGKAEKMNPPSEAVEEQIKAPSRISPTEIERRKDPELGSIFEDTASVAIDRGKPSISDDPQDK